jgi:hypothetical protein
MHPNIRRDFALLDQLDHVLHMTSRDAVLMPPITAVRAAARE